MTEPDITQCGNCDGIDPSTCFVCRVAKPAGQPLDLGAIQARADAATPGPWWNDGHEIYTGEHIGIPAMCTWIGETCTAHLPDYGDANGKFVANARQDIPNLVAEVRRLRAAMVQALAVLDDGPQWVNDRVQQHWSVPARNAAEILGAALNDAGESPDPRSEPCGEGHCICYGVGPDHADCACGCDCPRDIDGQLIDD